MNMQDKEIRARARAICEAATPGEWESTVSGAYVKHVPTDTFICKLDLAANGNAAFIAHARTALPAALDYIEQLEARAEKAESDLATISLHKNCEICGDTECPQRYSVNGCINFEWRGFSDKPTTGQEGE